MRELELKEGILFSSDIKYQGRLITRSQLFWLNRYLLHLFYKTCVQLLGWAVFFLLSLALWAACPLPVCLEISWRFFLSLSVCLSVCLSHTCPSASPLLYALFFSSKKWTVLIRPHWKMLFYNIKWLTECICLLGQRWLIRPCVKRMHREWEGMDGFKRSWLTVTENKRLVTRGDSRGVGEVS